MWVYWMFSTLLLAAVWSLSMSSWFLLWVTLEVTLLLCMPLVLTHESAASDEGLLKYFLIQVAAGVLILMGALAPQQTTNLIGVAALIKLGAAPLFMWVPHVFSTQSYWSIGVLSTIMKTPGLVVLSHAPGSMPLLLGLVTICIGCAAAVSFSALKKILAYSSVTHTGWLVVLASINSSWLLYFSLYISVTGVTVAHLNKMGVKSTYQLMTGSIAKTLISSGLVLSLAGFPPLLGFYLKVMAISALGGASPLVAIAIGLFLTMALFYYLSIFICGWLSAGAAAPKTSISFSLSLALTLSAAGMLII